MVSSTHERRQQQDEHQQQQKQQKQQQEQPENPEDIWICNRQSSQTVRCEPSGFIVFRCSDT
ncbi:hypothetical protein ACSSS7_006570 [Eimeria intestinalis]